MSEKDPEVQPERKTLMQVLAEIPYEEIVKVLKQVERPRANLGGGGPPGRAD